MRRRDVGAALVCLFATTAPGQSVPENAEPNDSAATATPLLFGQQGIGHLGSAGDAVDYWHVSLSQPSDVLISVSNRTAPSDIPIGAARLSAHRTDGIVVAPRDVLILGGKTCSVNSGFERWILALPGGDTYFAVHPATWCLLGQPFPASGTYAIDAVLLGPASSCTSIAVLPAASEPDHPGSHPGPTTLPGCSRITGGFDSANDLDFYRFTLPTTATVDARYPATYVDPFDFSTTTYHFPAELRLADGVTPTGTTTLGPGTYYAVVPTQQILPTGEWLTTSTYELTVQWEDPNLSFLFASNSYTGSACPSTTGSPVDIRAAENERPIAGSTFSLELRWMPAGSVGAIVFTLAPTEPGIDLGVIGAPGCELSILGFHLATDVGPGWGFHGVADVALPRELSGFDVAFQGAVFDVGANPLNVVTTEVLVAAVRGA